MPRSYPPVPATPTPFVVTTYSVDDQGNLTPDMPTHCLRAAILGERAPRCRIRTESIRHRKCGPSHPLHVVRCCTHEITFTLYPPGFAPYRRQAVVVVGPDGAQMDTDEVSALKARFRGTLFEAALDADKGKPWARECDGKLSGRWWPTQGRHLKLTARIVGVAIGLSDRTRQAIAEVLAIDALTLIGLARGSGDGLRGYRAHGKAILSILERLPRVATAAVLLLRCGHLIGQWGEPLHWDSKGSKYDRNPFHAPRTAPSS